MAANLFASNATPEGDATPDHPRFSTGGSPCPILGLEVFSSFCNG
jgi:hypothetical protein